MTRPCWGASVVGLLACSADGPTLHPSERGPAMVHVEGGTVRIGRRQTPPVEGFTPPVPPGPPPGGGQPGAAQPGAAQPGGAPNPPPSPAAPGLPGGIDPPTSGPVPLPDLGLPAAQRGGGPNGPVPSGPLPSGPGQPEHGAQVGSVIVEVGPYFIDVTEVTRAQYAAFLVETGYRPPYVDEPWAEDGWNWSGPEGYPSGTADHPVVLVSWYDAENFCAWAGKRLPTEAEWQLAVLGPMATDWLFPWGNTYKNNAENHGKIELPNYDDTDGFERTSPVGSFPAGDSPYGLKDGFGNAWEWVADRRVQSRDEYVGTRRGEHIVNAHTEGPALYAAVRGGSFFFDLRPNPGGEFNSFLNELRRKSSGFRCARDAG